MDLESR